MKRYQIVGLILLGLILAISLYGFFSNHNVTVVERQSITPFEHKMDHSQMMVKNEQDFINKMIPHHEEAVASAKAVLAAGAGTPEIEALASNIITTQEKEIADMKAWYKDWYGEPYVPQNDYKAMMRDLTNLTGAEVEKAFLEDMIPHHEGAIMMAQEVKSHIEHPEIENLAEAIINTQSAEISLIQQLLSLFQ